MLINDPINFIDVNGQDFWSAAGSFVEGAAWAVVGGVVIAGAVATGTVVGGLVAAGMIGYGAWSLGAGLAEVVTGKDIYGNPVSEESRIDTAAGIAGGVCGGAFSGRGFARGKEWSLPFGIEQNPNGKPGRFAPFGNRTGHEWGEFPHYHRSIWDPHKPGASLPNQSLKQHRPYEGGW